MKKSHSLACIYTITFWNGVPETGRPLFGAETTGGDPVRVPRKRRFGICECVPTEGPIVIVADAVVFAGEEGTD